jgi:Fungal specific transcription factor domain
VHHNADIPRTPEQSIGKPAVRQSLQTPTTSLSTEAQVESQDGFGEVNHHTQGTEYYGPTGIYSFLLRLRSRALSKTFIDGRYERHQRSQLGRPRSMRDLSIVNFLHTPDYHAPGSLSNINAGHSNPSYPITSRVPIPSQEQSLSSLSHEPCNYLTSQPSSYETNFNSASSQSLAQTVIERECLRLFFQNLHSIHPIIEESAFLGRCEREIFGQQLRPTNDFLALFNAVLAVGAITAGQDTLLMKNAAMVASIATPSFLPLKFAKYFFERSKAYLGDLFEVCSLERVQTLFLLAVFCQNALKPHSCYMYSGMAVRSSLAIGIPNLKENESATASALWWALYVHEVEICVSAGREAMLRDPNDYRIPLPYTLAPNDPKQSLSEHMVALAHLLHMLNQETSLMESAAPNTNSSTKSLDLDQRLLN